jgi:ribosomal protein L37AE/L43A
VKTLWRYQCRTCTTWAVTADDMGKAVRCNGCPGVKVFKFTTEAEGAQDEKHWTLAKDRGVLHLPVQEQEHTCAHCGVTNEKVYCYARVWLCRPCYRATQPPDEPVKLLTPDEVKAAEEAQRKATKDYDNHHQFSSTGE